MLRLCNLVIVCLCYQRIWTHCVVFTMRNDLGSHTPYLFFLFFLLYILVPHVIRKRRGGCYGPFSLLIPTFSVVR